MTGSLIDQPEPTTYIRRISDIALDDPRYKRAGIIPMMIGPNGERHYALGLSRFSAGIFDFGSKRKPNETLIETAVREYHEESYDIFRSGITVESIIENNYEVIDGLVTGPAKPIESLDIIIPVDVDMWEIMREFKELVDIKIANSCDDDDDDDDRGVDRIEIVRIIWLNQHQMSKIYKSVHPIKFCNALPFHTYHRVLYPIQNWIRHCN